MASVPVMVSGSTASLKKNYNVPLAQPKATSSDHAAATENAVEAQIQTINASAPMMMQHADTGNAPAESARAETDAVTAELVDLHRQKQELHEQLEKLESETAEAVSMQNSQQENEVDPPPTKEMLEKMRLDLKASRAARRHQQLELTELRIQLERKKVEKEKTNALKEQEESLRSEAAALQTKHEKIMYDIARLEQLKLERLQAESELQAQDAQTKQKRAMKTILKIDSKIPNAYAAGYSGNSPFKNAGATASSSVPPPS